MRVLSHSLLQLARDDLGGTPGTAATMAEIRGALSDKAKEARSQSHVAPVCGDHWARFRDCHVSRKHHFSASSAFELRASNRASSTGFVLRASSLVFVSRFDRSSYQERRPEQRLVNAALRLCRRLCPQFGLLSALGLEH